MKTTVYIEYYGKQILESDILAKAEATLKAAGKKASDIKDLTLYVKPEENQVYYVLGDDENGSFSVD